MRPKAEWAIDSEPIRSRDFMARNERTPFPLNRFSIISIQWRDREIEIKKLGKKGREKDPIQPYAHALGNPILLWLSRRFWLSTCRQEIGEITGWKIYKKLNGEALTLPSHLFPLRCIWGLILISILQNDVDTYWFTHNAIIYKGRDGIDYQYRLGLRISWGL